jgi:predicted ATPase/DNA-binding SARP family transcriptional activator
VDAASVERRKVQTAAQLEYRLLGSLEVRREGERLELGAAKERALLAMLLLNSNRILSADQLIEALWPKKSPGRPQTAVQGYVSHLRRLLEPERKPGEPFSVLVTEPAGYVLKLEPMQLDIHCFERALEQAREALEAGQAQAAARLFAEGLSLFRGPPLADFTYEGWAQQEIARLEELQLAAIEARIDAEMAQGQAGELVGELEALVQSHPLRERLRAQLMLALYRAGRQAEALQAYQRARTALVSDLGIDPSPELQQLYKAILNQEHGLAAPAPGSPSNLPTPPTPLVGRQKELTELRGLLERSDVRLLTLTGAGGSGKTRLALELVGGATSEFRDGVWWVPLAALADPALVLPEIAQTVGARNGLTDHLRRRSALLLLDNFEQVVEAAAGLADLLAQAPHVRVVATSRVALQLSGEHEWPVPPLDREEAIALFGERARAVKPTFELDEHVTEICTRLDDMPLALELAAARVKVLAPEEILERLSHGLDLLTTGTRDAPLRQRTLRATIEWSYDLLSDEERQLFARLAVFVGGFVLEAAETVCAADLDPLQSLVDKSLLRRTEGGRFFMLETIREFGAELLRDQGVAEAVQKRQAEYFADFAEGISGRRGFRADATALDRLDADHDNLRTALAWAADHSDGQLSLRLVNAVSPLWEIRGHHREARRWIHRALEATREDVTPLRASVLVAGCDAARIAGEREVATAYANESLALSEQLGDKEGVGRALHELGELAVDRGDFEEGRTKFEQAIAVSREAGVSGSGSVNNLADLALVERNYAEAAALALQAATLYEQDGSRAGRAIALYNAGVAMVLLGDEGEGRRRLVESVRLCRQLGFTEATAWCVQAFAAVLANEGDCVTAARLLGASTRAIDDIALRFGPAEERIHEQTMSVLSKELTQEGLGRALAEGELVGIEAAADMALGVLD